MITSGRVLLGVFITMLVGDSYAAGPLIPLQVQPFGCLKSNNNYANLAPETSASP